MARYIDADKTIKNLDSIKELSELEGKFNEWQYARYIIKSSETEDVEPIIHGEWECICSLQSWQFVHEHYKCSVCNGEVEYESRYCPNCGAIMNESEEE